MARELKFDDEDNSAQEAKLQLLQELSELEDLLAQRFEAMQAAKKGIHECMATPFMMERLRLWESPCHLQ